MENEPVQPQSSPSATQKPPRSKVERVIVWSLIGLLIAFTAFEALARTGYEWTVKDLQAAIDERTEPLTLDDFNNDVKHGLPVQGPGDHEGRATVLYTWPSLVKTYQLHLEVAADGTERLVTFATGTDPAEYIRYRSPDASGGDTPEMLAEMEGRPGGGGPGGGGPGGGGPGGGGGRGERNPLQRLLSEPVIAELELNEEQKTQLTDLIENLQMEPMISAEERRHREADQRKMVVEKMKEFLDEKQIARAKQIVLHALGPSALTEEEVVKELALTPEQQEQIATVLEGQREKQQAIFQQVQDEEIERDAMRDLIATLREETNAELLAVLTDEQKQKWETLLGPAPPQPAPRPQSSE